MEEDINQEEVSEKGNARIAVLVSLLFLFIIIGTVSLGFQSRGITGNVIISDNQVTGEHNRPLLFHQGNTLYTQIQGSQEKQNGESFGGNLRLSSSPCVISEDSEDCICGSEEGCVFSSGEEGVCLIDSYSATYEVSRLFEQVWSWEFVESVNTRLFASRLKIDIDYCRLFPIAFEGDPSLLH